jgi:hypothetical protein
MRHARALLFVRLFALMLAVGSGEGAMAQVAGPSGSSPAASNAAARDSALRALATRLHLPLVDEAVAIFSTQLRRTLPAYFVNSVGQGANLGPQWRRGNPYFDSAVQQVDAALAAEETRGGPLLKLERSDLLYAVNIPWTRDEIAFVDETLATDLGHEAERALDAKAALQTIATLKRRIAAGPDGQGIAAAFADLDARAQAQFGDASLMLIALKGTDPQRAQRLQRLIESVTIAPSDAIGQRVVDRVSQRLLDAAAAQLPAVIATIANFRTRP